MLWLTQNTETPDKMHNIILQNCNKITNMIYSSKKMEIVENIFMLRL